MRCRVRYEGFAGHFADFQSLTGIACRAKVKENWSDSYKAMQVPQEKDLGAGVREKSNTDMFRLHYRL
jgi:hypothetical protein